MIILGLTGSIGMGKSTTAQMFRDEGIGVHDADAVVHNLYSGLAVPLVEKEFPGTTKDGSVDRNLLVKRVLGKPEAMSRLEKIIHPLVAEEREAFLTTARLRGDHLVVLDIPLLFETGGERHCDYVLVVSAPIEVQRQRVLSRPGMNEKKFQAILAKQVSDEEKRQKADFVIYTHLGMEATRSDVKTLIAKLTISAKGLSDA